VTNYYVYYRVDAARLDAVRRFVERFFPLVKKEFGIQGRWLRRRDDAATCMEVYEGVQDDKAFDALLEREASALGLERRIERFVACA
jgi:hypothetical protein